MLYALGVSLTLAEDLSVQIVPLVIADCVPDAVGSHDLDAPHARISAHPRGQLVTSWVTRPCDQSV